MTEDQEAILTAELAEVCNIPENVARRYVKRIVDRILIYCNRCDLPAGLHSTAIMMAEDMIKAGTSGIEGKTVSKIDRGDTSITYKDSAEISTSATALINNYEGSLNHFKKMNLPKG